MIISQETSDWKRDTSMPEKDGLPSTKKEKRNSRPFSSLLLDR